MFTIQSLWVLSLAYEMYFPLFIPRDLKVEKNIYLCVLVLVIIAGA